MNYPGGIKLKKSPVTNYGNRGMSLECDLNETNSYYRLNDIAIIHKKPTPITIRKINYISKSKVKITDAYFEKPSTTDYNGIYKGKYIDFEAKETSLLNYFPLSNIHKHQIKHIKHIINHGGIAFLIVSFKKLDEIYFLGGNNLISFIETNERKSIPISYFKEHGHLITLKYNPRLDYLKIIDEIYFKGEDYEKEI